MRTYAPADTDGRPGRPARRAVAGARRRPSRRPPAARRRDFADFPDWLDPRIVAGLASRGIERPYTHQAEAIEAVHAGEDVVVVTPTASGKTLCYALPILQAIAEDPAARALFLFPTKALGQDQVAEFGELSRRPGCTIVDLDLRRRHAGADPLGDPRGRPGRRDQPGHAPLGDPPPPHEVVPAVRAAPAHRHRRAAHVPRACSAGTSPTSCAGCSGSAPTTAATRSSSAARRRSGTRASWRTTLTGRPARLVDRNGAPAGERHVLLVDPPLLDPASGARGSARDPRPALGAAVPARRAPDDRLRAVAGRGRAAADRPARVAARELRAAHAGPRLSRRLPADRAAGHRARPARRRDPRRRRDERARARRRHRPARRVDPGRLSGLGRRRRGSSSVGPAGARARASRSSSRRAPRSTSTSSTTRSSCSRARPRRRALDPDNLHVLLAHLRAATFELPFEPGEVFGPGPGRRPARVPRRGGARPPGRRRALVLVERELPGLGDLAPDGGAGERRDHRHDPGPAARPRRGRPVQRPGPRPRAGDLHPRVGPVLRRPARVARAQGLRPPGRRRPLHLRQPGGDAQAARGLRRGAGDRRPADPRRGDGREPRDAVQEAQVRDRRERRLGTDRPARARAPDDGLLADRRRARAGAGGATSSTSRCSAPGGRSRPSRRSCSWSTRATSAS